MEYTKQYTEKVVKERDELLRAMKWIMVESGIKQPSWWSPDYVSETFDKERREAIHEVARHALGMPASYHERNGV